MSTSSARMLASSFLVSATLALSLPACDSSPPAGPTWTASTTGKRSCPQYANNTVIDAGTADVTLRDATTGKTKWTYKVDSIGGCPRVTKEAVYIADNEGKITALDPLTGKQKASFKTFGNYTRRAPVATPSGVHTEYTENLFTLDKSLKRELWEHEEESDLWIDGIAASGTTVVLVTRNGKAKALAGKSGRVLWTYTTPSHGRIAADIKIAGGVVYFGSHDGSVYALNLATGKKIWATKLDQGPAFAPHLTGNMVITPNTDHIHALDKKTGKKKWKHPTLDNRMTVATAGQAIYTDNETGEVTSLDAATGEIITALSSVPGGSLLATSPTHLYVWTDTELRAYKLITRAAN